MLLSEFIALDRWFDDVESEFGLLKKLSSLRTILQENSKITVGQGGVKALRSFTEEKASVAAAMASINLSGLTQAQIACLAFHEADNFLGEPASSELLEKFKDAGHDLAYLLDYVQSAQNSLNTAKSSIKTTVKGLRPYRDAISGDSSYMTEQPRFSLIFAGEVSVNTLSDLGKASKEWHKTISSICIALDIPVDEFRILGGRNGSFILDLYLTAAAIVPFGFILVRSLVLLERFAISMKKLHEIMDLTSGDERLTEIEKDLEELTDKYFSISKKIGTEDISKEVLREANVTEDKKPEADAHLQKAIGRILNHLRKGGGIDAYLPTGSQMIGDEENVKKAAQLFAEFRNKSLDPSTNLPKLLEGLDFGDLDSE